MKKKKLKKTDSRIRKNMLLKKEVNLLILREQLRATSAAYLRSATASDRKAYLKASDAFSYAHLSLFASR